MVSNEKAREYIGKSIALLRSIKRMTGKELAEKAGIHQPNVVKIENGQTNVGLDILESIAASMDCHVDLVDNRTGMVPTVLRELYVKTYGTISADDAPGKNTAETFRSKQAVVKRPVVGKFIGIHSDFRRRIEKSKLFVNGDSFFDLKITLNIGIVFQKGNGLTACEKTEVFDDNTDIAVAPGENNAVIVADPIFKLLHYRFKRLSASHIVVGDVSELSYIASDLFSYP